MSQLSREQVREVDRLAIHELGIPGMVLMENAGRNAAAVVLEGLGDICKVVPSVAQVAVLSYGRFASVSFYSAIVNYMWLLA